MAVYFALNAQNRPAPVHVQTWRDKLYVLFAMDYRNLVHDVHQVVSQTIHPAFQQKLQQPWNNDVSITETLRDRLQLLESDIWVLPVLVMGCNRNKSSFEFTWDRWSDLIDFKFWGTVLAYVIHAIALKIWDISGTSQKMDEIHRLHGDMHSNLFLTRVKAGALPDSDLFVSLLVTPVHKLLPVLNLQLHIPKQPGLYFKAERFWTHDGKTISERELLREAVDYKLLKDPGLLVTFDRTDRTEVLQTFQMKTAIELMVRENLDKLVIKTPIGLDFSIFGFEGAHDTWTIDRQKVDGFKISFEKDETMTWMEWIEKEQIVTEIPADRAFFPDGYLFPPQPVQP